MDEERLRQLMRVHHDKVLLVSYRDEIERAIANVKRSDWDKWFRRQWYRATGGQHRPPGEAAGGRGKDKFGI